jgi:CheY-like chemotaxis protein
MDETTRLRVFEPFFTTKAEVGSGLGLSTAYGTVMRSGGTMEVASELGRGTIFTVHLPVSEEAEVVEEPESVSNHALRSGRILLVDDDEMICRLLQRILSRTHKVEVVHDGADALQMLTPGRFDVALIDLGIPSVPGDKVAAHIRERDPTLITVLITGWMLEPGDPLLAGFDFHLPKPIRRADLEEIIAKAMALYDSRAQQLSKIST